MPISTGKNVIFYLKENYCVTERNSPRLKIYAPGYKCQYFTFHNAGIPSNWDGLLYGGPFPDGPCLALKLAVPSIRNKLRLDSTMHSVTLLISILPNLTNHLKLGKGDH